MINLIIVGTGAVSAEITGYIETADYSWNGEPIKIKGYLEFEEYRHLHKHYRFSAPILGTIDDYTIVEGDHFIIANANVALRKSFSERLKQRGASFINLIHPTCIIAPTSEIGIGNVLSPNCQIGPTAKVGDFNIMTTGTMISHDCVVGDYNSFSTVVVCGHATIGNSNILYIRSTVTPHITIGDGCTIQAGMVVDKDVPNGTTVFYKYKERILAIPQS